MGALKASLKAEEIVVGFCSDTVTASDNVDGIDVKSWLGVATPTLDDNSTVLAELVGCSVSCCCLSSCTAAIAAVTSVVCNDSIGCDAALFGSCGIGGILFGVSTGATGFVNDVKTLVAVCCDGGNEEATIGGDDGGKVVINGGT